VRLAAPYWKYPALLGNSLGLLVALINDGSKKMNQISLYSECANH
jgi:hypothetical protein